MLRWFIGIILGEIICESSNWQHIQRLKITILGPHWQLFRLERIAKCSYFILSRPTENIKFYWFVMNIKKIMLPIWWYNRGSFPLGNKYFGVFILNGLISRFCLLFLLDLVMLLCFPLFFNIFKKKKIVITITRSSSSSHRHHHHHHHHHIIIIIIIQSIRLWGCCFFLVFFFSFFQCIVLRCATLCTSSTGRQIHNIQKRLW